MIDLSQYGSFAYDEGWELFECSSVEGHDAWEVQIDNDFEPDKDDSDAWELIVRKAGEGSEPHLAVLAFLRQEDCHGELGNMYAHCAEKGIPWPVETPRPSWFAMSDSWYPVPQAGPFMSYSEAHDAVGHHRIHVLPGDEIGGRIHAVTLSTIPAQPGEITRIEWL